jgi:hypothetical protein
MYINLLKNDKKLMLIYATIIVSSTFLIGTSISSSINAQTQDKITISENAADFAPLTLDPTTNQLKVIVGYVVKDPELVNTQINGVMKVNATNGTLVKTSSYGATGFTLQGETGNVQFASSFKDQNLQQVTANIILMDLNKTLPLSNALSLEVPLNSTAP